MIVGIGNDIIEIERVEKAISKEGFIAKVYTQREIENIVKRGNRTETYAGIFSAKEAVSKAIGTGVREFALTDLEILNDDLGKPYVIVSDKLKKIIKLKLLFHTQRNMQLQWQLYFNKLGKVIKEEEWTF